jgi:hypothetical protein
MTNVYLYTQKAHKAITYTTQKIFSGKTRYKDNQNWSNLLDPIKINLCRSL